MTYAEFKAERGQIEAVLKNLGTALNAYPKGAMGLTLDSAKDARWHNLKAQHAKVFASLRDLNGKYAKKFKKEDIAERIAARLDQVKVISAA